MSVFAQSDINDAITNEKKKNARNTHFIATKYLNLYAHFFRLLNAFSNGMKNN